MYPGTTARTDPDRPAIIMARSGETLTFGELEGRSNRIAHLLRSLGLAEGGHYAVFMENQIRFLECCCAGHRAGLYYTCVNSYLTADEVAYILGNSRSAVLFTSMAKRSVASAALALCPQISACIVVDGPGAQAGEDARMVSLSDAVVPFPATPIADEAHGVAMLYSSGTTGQPKGILRERPDCALDSLSPIARFMHGLWKCRDRMVFLCPAPLYHSAPLSYCGLALWSGGTIVVMEQFDAAEFLALVQRHGATHSQLVPTMFSRMLKLPDAVRLAHDLSSLEFVTHGAAPCPVQVKEAMIDWWGPVIHEYYGSTEGIGFASCSSAEWLAHKGSTGKVVFGDLHILDDAGQPCAAGQTGTLWFGGATFEYFDDPVRTREARSPDGGLSTVGDVGYLDGDGYLYLTDRASFMIISGGVNIYPQECENLLVTHPKVADAAVFGVPNEDLGEEVKAAVQLMPGISGTPELAQELMAFCAQHLSRQKCPRSIDFESELPRLPTGKLYKRLLRDRYWASRTSRIV